MGPGRHYLIRAGFRKLALITALAGTVPLAGLSAAYPAFAQDRAGSAVPPMARTVTPTPIELDGASVTATITAPATQAVLSFSLTHSVTLIATYLSWTFPADGAVSAQLTTTSGTQIGQPLPLNGSGPWQGAPQQLTAGGYDLVVDAGTSGDSGSVTVQLTSVGSITVNGGAVAATIAAAGQPQIYAFTATAGESVAVGAAGSTFTTGSGATLDVESATGSAEGPAAFLSITSAVPYATATLPKAGTYYVALRPATAGATGTADLSLVSAAAPVPVTVGGPAVTVTISQPGVSGTATFSGTAGETVGIEVSANTFTGLTTRLYVIDSAGDPVGEEQYLNGGAAVDGPVTLPSTGTYTVVIDPAPGRPGRADRIGDLQPDPVQRRQRARRR